MSESLDLLTVAVQELVSPGDAVFPGGYPKEIELALLDAVLSIRARYGKWPETGVGRRVMTYKAARGGIRCDDLAALSVFDAATLSEICGGQKTGGRLKSLVIQDVATRLADLGVRHSPDVRPSDEAQRRVYVQTKGLGPVTWRYFGMLLGHDDVKPDRMIMRFASNAVGRNVGAEEAGQLVREVAARLDMSTSALDHAIWRYQRSQRMGP